MREKLSFAFLVVVSMCGIFMRAGESRGQTFAKQPSLLYKVDAEFTYLDTFPGSQSLSTSTADDSTEGDSGADPSPTLGLRRAAFDLEWQMPRGLSLFVSLRPDAGTGGDDKAQRREVDTRAGRVIEESPTVHLLDEYRVTYRARGAETRFGVERYAVSPYRLSGEILDFGLRPRGPEKVFAASVFVPTIYEAQSGGKLSLTASAIGGRDERSDSRYGGTGGAGQSPAKRDPYWGGVSQVEYSLPDVLRTGLAFAFLEERKSGIKIKNGLYQFGIRRSIDSDATTSLSLAVEARQLRQSYELEGATIADQSLSSIGLTGLIGRKSGEGVLFGVWSGTGNLHPEGLLTNSYATRGQQVVGGWQWLLEDVLRVSAHVAREWRVDHGSEGRGGGFADGDDHKAAINRIAIDARFLLNGQI